VTERSTSTSGYDRVVGDLAALRRGLADADLLDHARFLRDNGFLMMLFGGYGAILKARSASDRRAVDAAALGSHVLLAQ
jgi:hypothetical protein